jgi:hypothetical protein
MTVKKSWFFWPMKRPSATKPLNEASAPEFPVEVGRMSNRRKLSVVVGEEMGWLGHDQVGLQRIPFEGFRVRLSLRVSEFVNVTVAPVPPGPLSSSVNGSALPALSCQV